MGSEAAMIGPLLACLITVPSPPAHATDTHLAAWEAWQADNARAQWQECAARLEEANGPYVVRHSPSAAPSAPQPKVTVSAGVEQWRSLVAAIWPADQVDKVLRVMQCESGGDPGAVSPTNDHGLMQINAPTWESTYGPVETWYDPTTNLTVALAIWRQGGWAWWACG